MCRSETDRRLDFVAIIGGTNMLTSGKQA